MIVFDLSCHEGHRFEGWFSSSTDYADQQERGLLACPSCGSAEVSKAPMAPAVPAKGNTRQEVLPPEAPRQVANTPMPPEVQKALAALAKAQAAALKNSTWVGDKFAEETRKMHYGERDEAPIHGQASLAEAKALIDEGVPVAPLPFPVAPPEKLN
ncbi:hypothetical protein FHS52_001958 [Erythromicrobium ramosum]|uniref:DUF1178 family protein n=1 Tax=Erythrobacter ramosus TaxID=35811 RepID=A0A6I4UNB2_9SPHN|nr:DUF1178 family protein [Erythrobacter ramosus]MBB3775989.1 hypothetical protein [Erythrobacter ramosus]MXP38923.1 DUF1178 family protein [Erythrobacter ramosus]